VLLFTLQGILVAPLFPALTLIFIFMAQNSVKYAREESERKAVRNAFGHYLSNDLINTLVQSPEKLTLGGEQKPLTMLFCDIRGFTTFSEQMTPQELTSFLNDYLTPMTDTLLRHNATIDKYMGDAIMAFWNAPLDIPDHTRHACTAALAMMARLNELNPQWQKRGLPNVSIGVGIHTGFASVGNMGSAQRFDYTVIGDAVNLASRLEGISKHYGVSIIVSAQVRKAVPDGIFLPLDLVAVKGRNEPVEVFTLLGIGAPTERQRQLVETAQAAHAAYRARQWDRAAELFTQLEDFDVLRDDFLARIAEHKRLPPPDSWDGAYHATHK
jgi:adenylate cyclase